MPGAEFALNQTGVQNALSVSTSAVSLTLPTGVNARPTHAVIYISGAPVRWRADGTAPTATIGQFLGAESRIELMDPLTSYAGFLQNVQFIQDTTAGSAATLDAAFFQ